MVHVNCVQFVLFCLIFEDGNCVLYNGFVFIFVHCYFGFSWLVLVKEFYESSFDNFVCSG